MNEVAALGVLVKETRERLGVEAKDIADHIKVSPGTISNLERGITKTTPPPMVLRGISESLGIPMVTMLEVLGYLDRSSDADSNALMALRPILEGRNLTDKQVRQIADMVRGMLEMMEG